MALQLLHGDIEQLRREYMVLFARGVSITRKLGFSDIIMPGSDPKTLVVWGGRSPDQQGIFRVQLRTTAAAAAGLLRRRQRAGSSLPRQHQRKPSCGLRRVFSPK